jgi:pimeloyl-ACP methyl ester carboxylesterase
MRTSRGTKQLKGGPKMEVKVRGTPMHYQEFGEGTPILMLHGWPGDNRHMISDFEPLFQKREGWRRIYPDLPGMGKSPKADWITSQDEMLEALLGFVDKVIPEEPFAVAGVSYGGFLIQGLVYRRPQMILGGAFLVPVLDVGQEEISLPNQITLVRDDALLARLNTFEKEIMESMVTVQSPELVEDFRKNVMPAFEIADHEFLDSIEPRDKFNYSFDVKALTKPYDKPVLFLMGKQDSVWGYSTAWKILPNFTRASFVVLDRAAHFLVFEQNDLFLGLINEWLDRVEESSGKN